MEVCSVADHEVAKRLLTRHHYCCHLQVGDAVMSMVVLLGCKEPGERLARCHGYGLNISAAAAAAAAVLALRRLAMRR
jgi:hypothetical protein